MDSLLAGTLILPWRVHCAGLMSSAAVPVEIIPGFAKAIPGSGENRSHSRRNHCSPSARNRVRLRPGTLFAFTPEYCSPSPGIGDRDGGVVERLQLDLALARLRKQARCNQTRRSGDRRQRQQEPSPG